MRFNFWYWLSILVVVLGVIYLIRTCEPNGVPKVQYIYIKDTIKIIDTFLLVTKPKIIVKKDTIYKEKILPVLERRDTIFEACIDTLIDGFKLNACYQFPVNQFVFKGKYTKDTIIVREMFKVKEVQKAWFDEWYNYLSAFIVGGLIGFAIGK